MNGTKTFFFQLQSSIKYGYIFAWQVRKTSDEGYQSWETCVEVPGKNVQMLMAEPFSIKFWKGHGFFF